MAKYEINPNNPGALVALDEEAAQVLARIEAGESSRHAVRESLTEAKLVPKRPAKAEQSLGPGWVKVPIPDAKTVKLEHAFQSLGMTPEQAKIAAALGPAKSNDGFAL